MATVLTPAEIKQKITDWITTNGQGDITGAHLNTILAAIMDYVGVGYAFMGEAPASAPSPDVPSAYLAAPGTYTNYESGDTVIPEGSIAVLKYDGSAWSKSVIKVCDPVSVSQNTITLGGSLLFSSLEQLDFYKGVINWHIGYINNQGQIVNDTDWKYTPLFPKILYDYFDVTYPDSNTQTNLYKNGQWAGYVNNSGWHNANGDVIQQENADYDSWLYNINANVYTDYQSRCKVKASLYELTQGYRCAGVAALSTNPSNLINTFYFASQIGVYTNFGNIRVFDGEQAILKYDGSSWLKETINNGRYTSPVVDLFEGSIDWIIGYDSGSIMNHDTDWRRTPIYPRSLFNAFEISYPSGYTQTNLYKNGVIVGHINYTGWHQSGSSSVVEPYSIEFDSWMFDVNMSYHPNYESLIVLKAKIKDIIIQGSTLALLDKIVFGGALTWIADSYYNFLTGELTGDTSIYTCTVKYPKILLDYFASTDYIGQTFLSLWNNSIYVGSYRWDGEYHDTTGAVVSEPIDFDTFAVNVYKVYDPNYLNKYRIKAIEDKAKSYSYYALGDSITYGAYADNYSYADHLNNTNKYPTYSKLAVSGSTCMHHEGSTAGRLSSQVAQIPNNTTGLITVMIGVNDVAIINTLGSVADALAANYADLDDETTFANAFRYNIETIKRNSPDANLVVLIPLRCKPLGQWPNATDEHLEEYREVERGICKALSVPYIDTDEECGISLLYNWSTFMADGFHPNSTGQERIAKFLINRLEPYCGRLD